MKMYLKMMADKGNYELSYADSLMDVMTGAKTKALVPVRHLYIIMDDKEYLTNERIRQKFKGLKDDIVVFYYSTTDKRLKFWKESKDTAVEFTRLNDQVLTKYIQKEAPFFTEGMCKELIDVCDGDYGRILLEIDKIKQYCRAEKVKGDYVFRKFIDEGGIYNAPYDAIFDFVAAFLERTPSKAYDLLQQSKAIGEANLTLLAVLYNNIKTLLQVQSTNDCKAAGINKWQANNVLPFKGNYKNGELVKAMKLIRSVEKGIKTGTMPDDLAVEYIMVSIM
jgi:DNA polymerase III delta subunit